MTMGRDVRLSAESPIWIDPPDDSLLPRLSMDAEEAVRRVNRKVAAGRSLNEVLNFVFDSTRSLYPCDRLGLALLEEDGRRVTARWARADYEPLQLGLGYSEDTRNSSLMQILQTGRLRILPDLEAYARAHPHSASTRLIVAEGAKSSLTCPLRVENRIVGLLFRSSRCPNAYRSEHAYLHLHIAERLSQAVEAALQLDRLTEANRAATEMLGFVSHELKTPLNAILNNSELLQAGTLGPLTPPQQERVFRIRQSLDRMISMVRDYLDFARMEDGEFRAQIRSGVSLAESVIEPILHGLEPEAEARSMRIVRAVAENLRVRCDPDLLGGAISNLLGNAVKYGREGGLVVVRALRSDSEWVFSVRNDGIGFTAEQKPRLFRRFSRLKEGSAQYQPGTGLGLYTVWRVIEQHGGRVYAESFPGEWAEFGFRIPLTDSQSGE